MFSHCRICRTKKGLKFSKYELGKLKKLNGEEITGNICWDCDERLLNFDKIFDDEENGNTVIVDDDALLYSSFFDRNIKKNQTSQHEKNFMDYKSSLETIEVLTSRENTPDRQPLLTINLESENESCDDLKTTQIHNYSESIERIVLSSDSDVEIGNVEFNNERCLKDTREKISKSNVVHTCFSCNQKYPTKSALKIHSRDHSLVNCPKCPVIFTCSLKLVRHIRTQHRTYSGNILLEKPKLSRDSEMTIRLKYMTRFSYFECNLCGQIDSKYLSHREHILSEHAEESKRLDEPPSVEIKCPVCFMGHKNHIQLYRHLRQTHRENCESYFQIIKKPKFQDLPWHEQRLIIDTSRVYKLIGRPNHYFECILCENVCAGHFNHWKHLRKHDLNNSKSKNNLTSLKNIRLDKKISKASATKKHVINVKSDTTKRFKKEPNLSRQKSSNKSSKISSKVKPLRKMNYRPLISSSERKKQTAKSSRKPMEKIIKRIVNQKYCCSFCSAWFIGYKSLNLHRIFFHSLQEFGQLLDIGESLQQQRQLFHRRKFKKEKIKNVTTTTTGSENKKPEIFEENSINHALIEKNQRISRAYQRPFRQLCCT